MPTPDQYPVPLGHEAGKKARVRKAATTTSPAGVWSAPIDITPVVTPVLVPGSVDFNQNLVSTPVRNAQGTVLYEQRSPFASFTFDTDANTHSLKAAFPLAEGGVSPGCTLSVYDQSGNFVTGIVPTGTALIQDITFTLPGAGTRRYTIVEGASSEAAERESNGVYLLSISRTGGSRLNKVPALKANNVVVVGGDSIANGYVTSNNSRFGMLQLLRNKLGSAWHVALSGFAGAHAYARYPDANTQYAEAQRILTYFTNVTGSRIYVDMVGTNAFGYRPVAPEVEAAAKAAIWDIVHAQNEAARIIQVMPMVRPDAGNANNQGKTLNDYIAAYQAEAVKRPWVQVVNTSTSAFLALSDIADGVHPNEGGHEKLATRLQSILTSPYSPPAAKSIVGMTIMGGSTITEGTSAPFPLRVSYYDGSTEQVTSGVTYYSSEGTYALGTLTIPSNTIVGDGHTVTLNATYQAMTVNKNVTVIDASQTPTNPTTLTYKWEGVIGTTSDNPIVDPVRSFSEMRDITATPYGYFMAGGYNEDRATVKWFGSHATRNQHKAVMASMATVVDHITSDNQYVYVAVNGNGYNNTGYRSGIRRLNAQTRQEAPMSQGSYWNTSAGEYRGVALFDNDNSSSQRLLSGIAVEKNNSLLAASAKNRGGGIVNFANKDTGAFVGSLSIPTPEKMCFGNDGILWVVTNGTLKRFQNNGSRSQVNFVEISTLPSLVRPLAMAVRPNGNMLVMDGGTSQQIKEFNAAGVKQADPPFLQGGNLVSNPDISHYRLLMLCRGGLATQAGPGGPYNKPMAGLSVDPDGSYWVCDCGNFRVQHYSSDWTYLGQSAFMPDLFKVCVDQADPTRVFVDYQEYKVNWTLPLKTGDQTVLPEDQRSWLHVKNWSAGLNVDVFTNNSTGIAPMHFVNTYTKNGRTVTYAFMNDSVYKGGGWRYAIFEIPTTAGTPLRKTPQMIMSGPGSARPHHPVKHPDGREGFGYWEEGSGKAFFIPIQGIDASRNLILGGYNNDNDLVYNSQETLVNFNPGSGQPRPLAGWNMPATLGITEDGTLTAFFAPHSNAGTKHVGGVKIGGTGWAWQNLPSKLLQFPDPNWYPAIGSETVQYGNNGFGGHHGVGHTTCGKLVLCLYDGQNGKNANQTYVYHQNGTFLGQFGRPSQANPDMTDDNRAPAGYANNIGWVCSFRIGNKIIQLKTDEACFGAIHVESFTLPVELQ